MAHQVVWEKMALQNGDGTDTILKRGEILPDGVDEFLLGVYLSTGAVRFVEDKKPEAAKESEELPSEIPSSTGKVAPAVSAHKPDWVDYAVYKGMDRTAAERLSKEALINRFGS